MKKFDIACWSRIILATLFSIVIIANCGDGGNGGALNPDGGPITSSGGITSTANVADSGTDTAAEVCIYTDGVCSSDANCSISYTCQQVLIHQPSPHVLKACIPKYCLKCNMGCNLAPASDPWTCEFPQRNEPPFCATGTPTTSTGGSATTTTTTSTGGTTTVVTPPKVNCDSYSFRGCSDVGSATFSSNCIRVGCNFKKTNCKTSGTVSSTTTCDCVCY